MDGRGQPKPLVGVLKTIVVCLFVLTALGSCVGAEDSEPVRTERQGQYMTTCGCTLPMGDPGSFECYDTCFAESPTCEGEPDAPCDEVCNFPLPDASTFPAGQDCERRHPITGNVMQGVCHSVGVGPSQGPGCCVACLDGTGTCGGLFDVNACGPAGFECVACQDERATDCYEPSCYYGNCTQNLLPEGTSCLDENGVMGQCLATPAPGAACCTTCRGSSDGACVPDGLSNARSCGRGGDVCTDCDDGDPCNGAETCNNGSCQAGQPLDCDDNNPCTDDSCIEFLGCTNASNTRSCNDGDPCTENDTCGGGTCHPGTTIDCNDGNDCTIDACSGGTCQNAAKANTTACVDETSGCGSMGQCEGGLCIVTTNCHDQTNPCLTSYCGPAGDEACSEVDKPDGTACDDGNPCTSGDNCQSGACTGTGTVDCDDANACTDDACDSAEGCTHTDTSGDCNDGDRCTDEDTCVSGECEGQPRACEPTNSCQEQGVCVPDTGTCAYTNKEDGAECADGGECFRGVCGGVDAGSGGGAGDSGGGTGGDSGSADSSGGAEPGADGTETGSGGTSASTTGDRSGGTGGSGGSLGAAGGKFTGEAFVREPGGCDCRQARGRAPGSIALLGLLGLLGALLLGRRGSRSDHDAGWGLVLRLGHRD